MSPPNVLDIRTSISLERGTIPLAIASVLASAGAIVLNIMVVLVAVGLIQWTHPAAWPLMGAAASYAGLVCIHLVQVRSVSFPLEEDAQEVRTSHVKVLMLVPSPPQYRLTTYACISIVVNLFASAADVSLFVQLATASHVWLRLAEMAAIANLLAVFCAIVVLIMAMLKAQSH